jgi:hypothetical protein
LQEQHASPEEQKKMMDILQRIQKSQMEEEMDENDMEHAELAEKFAGIDLGTPGEWCYNSLTD